MMKFRRIIRNSRDTVVHVVMVDYAKKVVELWRWSANPEPLSVEIKPVLVREQTYGDPSERFGILQKFEADARGLSKQAV